MISSSFSFISLVWFNLSSIFKTYFMYEFEFRPTRNFIFWHNAITTWLNTWLFISKDSWDCLVQCSNEKCSIPLGQLAGISTHICQKWLLKLVLSSLLRRVERRERKADWKNVDSVQNSRVKFFLVEQEVSIKVWEP